MTDEEKAKETQTLINVALVEMSRQMRLTDYSWRPVTDVSTVRAMFAGVAAMIAHVEAKREEEREKLRRMEESGDWKSV